MGIFDRFVKKGKAPSAARFESQLDGLLHSVTTLRTQSRWQEALPLARQTADLARSDLGEAHPRYAGCLGNLAGLHRQLGTSSTCSTGGPGTIPNQSGIAPSRARQPLRLLERHQLHPGFPESQ
jgi:hypothetical protein